MSTDPSMNGNPEEFLRFDRLVFHGLRWAQLRSGLRLAHPDFSGWLHFGTIFLDEYGYFSECKKSHVSRSTFFVGLRDPKTTPTRQNGHHSS